MNIVVIGQGAIGLLWYHHLAKMPALSVSLSASTSAQQIPRHYSFTHLNNQTTQQTLTIADDKAFADAQCLLFCVKSYQVQAALAALKHKIAPETVLIFCHNGMGALDDITSLSQPVLTLLTTHACKILNPFHAQHTGLGHHHLGLLHGALSTKKNQQITAALAQALPTLSFNHDIVAKQWLKLAINCVINPITALENINNGQLLVGSYNDTISKLIAEIVKVAAAEDIVFDFKQLQASIQTVAKNTADNCSSMRADILNQRKTEIDFINGYIMKVAHKHRLSVPENQQLYQKIKALEAKR
ncbi:ketopantoate reductase [Colwellia chukchiensis]|uniref:2-dehydropantoate 2-reductase n=1 Tax=Colwellia chukchiensis TaxID=641665 RepID=A0A1H7HRX4_9GAMM|nr:2-dehydropantoate 2-reductase [Colwellia chukchiensis]SEK53009.1 ketopantoate reductase [Colwellia chukchiensis]